MSKVIGRWVPKPGNTNPAFDVVSAKPSDYKPPASKGRQPNGNVYHVCHDYWTFVPAVWNGEGVPPAGTVCEVCRTGGDKWRRCEILCVGNTRVFYRDFEGDEITRSLAEVKFRPIPTGRETAIAAMMTKVVHAVPHDCALLYDDGYRKVPDLHLLATRLSGVAGVGHADRDRMEKVLQEVLG